MGHGDHLSTTELDSHANMPVAGKHSTIICTSGLQAEVAAYSPDLPSRKIDVVDVAWAYDDPFTLKTYLLVARNALFIPAMDHNLIAPMILREAGLTVNEVAKRSAEIPSVEHHSIFDEESKLRIHLQLKGIFSCFETRALTMDEMENWEDHEVIFLTPDSATWNPHSDHFEMEEAAMLDSDGDIIARERAIQSELITEADVSGLYVEPLPWKRYDELVDKQFDLSCINSGVPFDEHEACKLNEDPIRATISEVNGMFEPEIFAATMNDSVQRSKVAMALGSMTKNDFGCELFEAMESAVAEAIKTLSAVTAGGAGGVSAEHLSKIFRISNQEAERTLDATSQLNCQDANSSLARNFGTNDRMFRYRRLNSIFFTDTLYVTAAAKSTRMNIGAQLYVSDKGFVAIYPIRETKQFMSTLRLFAKDVGAPKILVLDPHPTQKKREVKDFCNKIGTTLKVLENETQWADRAELYIGLIKEATRKDMREMHSPLVFWDYAMERRAFIYQVTSKSLFQLNGSNPYTATFGEEADISHICQFGWYQWVYFREQSAAYPHMKECLGRCLGPAKNEGNAMAQWILKGNGKVVPRRTCRHLTPSELAPSNETERRKRSEFDASITQQHGDSFKLPPVPVQDPNRNPQDGDFDLEPYEDDVESPAHIPAADLVDFAGKPILQESFADRMINAEVLLPHGEMNAVAKVVKQSVDADGKVIGSFNENPMLNTLVYECEFSDGTTKEYAANIIAENIFLDSDQDGHRDRMMVGIVDHKRSGEAVRKEQGAYKIASGQKRLRQTTVGWSLLVEWSDGSKSWIDLKVLKESNPVQAAEYAVSRGIETEPAFAWWVPFTLRKRDTIIAAVNTRVKRKTHKYGIEVPTSIKDALRLDKKNGNSFWTDSVNLEMSNVGIAFEVLRAGEKAPPGWRKSSGHIIFDVKMDFTRKARWVKDGHRTPDPITSSYAGVVSRESVRIALTHAALHGIETLAADIRNAYLQAPSSEKDFIICGPEFGLENCGRVALIRRALYGGKVAGRDFWHHLRACMKQLGFVSSKADPDVWFRLSKRSKRKANSSGLMLTECEGEEYYEYVLLYVDDCLVISDRAEPLLREEIGQHFMLKEKSIGPPSQYLGGKLRKVTMDNGVDAWAWGSSQYVQAAVKNVEEYLEKRGEKLVAKAPTPLSSGYRPEIDISQELAGAEASYFHSLIGVLRWIVELGRADICIEASMMSSHLALPRQGHMKELYHMFAYLKKHHNAEMVFDPTPCDFDESVFDRKDWTYSAYGYKELKEVMPNDMPKPCGPGFTMRVYVDADHAGDLATRKSRTGFVIFLNQAPIYWSSKRQNSTETSTFGAEFCAMKVATEYVRGLRYKLRMMGIPVHEPAFVFGDNQSVLANTTDPASTLKKKSHSLAFHHVREGCARDEWRTAYVNTHDNVADLFTKPLPSGEKRWKFVRMLLHHL